MRRIHCWLLCSSLIIAACGGHERAKRNDLAKSAGDTASWYRRYKGTIGGEPVVVNLYHYGNNKLRGTYYYNKRGILLELSCLDDSTRGHDYYLYESVATERGEEGDVPESDHWRITIGADDVQGSWNSATGKKAPVPIQLKESYTDGGYRFTLLTAPAVGAATTERPANAARADYTIAVPGSNMTADEVRLINGVLIRHINTDSSKAETISAAIAVQTALLHKNSEETEEDASDDAEENTETDLVIYNQDGIVVYEFYDYSFTGGVHGYYNYDYACIDMRQRKIWKLADVMQVDTTKLLKLLEAETRKQFHIHKDSALNTALLVDSLKLTDNIYFTHTGIVFSYGIYEIASYADGQVALFLPFSSMMDMLTPAFRKRMKL